MSTSVDCFCQLVCLLGSGTVAVYTPVSRMREAVRKCCSPNTFQDGHHRVGHPQAQRPGPCSCPSPSDPHLPSCSPPLPDGQQTRFPATSASLLPASHPPMVQPGMNVLTRVVLAPKPVGRPGCCDKGWGGKTEKSWCHRTIRSRGLGLEESRSLESQRSSVLNPFPMGS